MQRLFLDANVLFSAALSPTGTARALFALADAGQCELLTSAYAYSEARRNLELKSIAAVGELPGLMHVTREVAEPPRSRVEFAARLLPDKDAPILAAAIAAEASALVTGDQRHFGPLYGRTLGGVVVLTPRQAVEFVLT